MKIPIEWLRELVNFRLREEELAKALTMAGLETMVLPDHILEIDVLPNRSDCLNIQGIAREISALLKLKIKNAKFKINELSEKRVKNAVRVEVKEKKLCPRYMVRVIEGVKIGESPAWLKSRLNRAGLRPINNVVDVTNYLLLELGQPLHAFDAQLVKNQQLIVRCAQPQERVITLDGQEQILDSEMLVIADPEKAIAIAGIMGCANTEVNSHTSVVFLESACFNPVSIHKTSKLLKVRTESSIRFEHGVDWQAVEEALDRGAALIAQLAGGKILRGKIEVKRKELKPKIIDLRPERVNQILGTDISVKEIINILERLGFKVPSKNRRRVEIPLFRASDISREIDLIEEIARLYGYGKISPTLPLTAFWGKSVNRKEAFRSRVKEIMAGCGLNEVQTYSMIGPKDFERWGLKISAALQISNPLAIEESYLRISLLPSLLNCVVYNLHRQRENVFIFEIGKIFLSSAELLPEERWSLCAVATGSPFLTPLDKGKADYFYMKGILENLFSSLGIKNIKFTATDDPLLQPGKGAEIESLGMAGQLHPRLQRNFELDKGVYFFEIDLEGLFNLSSPEKKFIPLPKFPAVSRDLAMFVPKGISYQEIFLSIKEAGGELIEDISLFDQYKDSLAFRLTYRHPQRTLTDEEVNQKHKEIGNAVVAEFKVQIRA